MIKIFVDVKVLEMKEGSKLPITEKDLSEELKEDLIKKWIDLNQLNQAKGIQFNLGYLLHISEKVKSIFSEREYFVHNKLIRNVGDNFLQNENIVYDTKKAGSIYVVDIHPYASHILGVIIPPITTEMIGLVKTEINIEDNELIERIRACYKEYSNHYLEKNTADLSEKHAEKRN